MKIQPYKTIKSCNESELKDKRSIFLAKVYPVSYEDEVDNILNGLKKKYYDASHRCYAYRLLSGNSKFSDAGEPSGTAGIRILNAIDHNELQDCLVVVIRYFGGIKLGIGLLGKAYYSVAVQLLSESDIVTKKPYLQAEIKLAISSLDKLNIVLKSNQIKILEANYTSVTTLKCLIPQEKLEKLRSQIIEALKGKVEFLVKNVIFSE